MSATSSDVISPMRCFLCGLSAMCFLMAGLYWGLAHSISDIKHIAPWVISCGIGFLAGAIEIIQRYSHGNSIRAVFLNKWAFLYLFVNISASAVVFGALSSDGLPGVKIDLPVGGSAIWLAVVSGLAGMLILRSAAITVKNGDKERPIGLGVILEVLMVQIDHRVDQIRAVSSADEIATIMQSIDPEKASTALTVLVLQMLERTSPETQESLKNDVQILMAQDLPINSKAIILGFIIQKVGGIQVLKKAVDMLNGDIVVGQRYQPDSMAGHVNDGWSSLAKELDDSIEKMNKVDFNL